MDLARAGRKDGKRGPAGEERIDDLFLSGTEGVTWTQGTAMTLDESLAYALAEADTEPAWAGSVGEL